MSDYKCPKCGAKDGFFYVSGSATFMVDSDGSVQDYCESRWDDNAEMDCRTCNHSSIVRDFTNTEEATA